MRQIIASLLHDEAGFILSAELVLIATIGVLSLVVGLSEVAFNINQELEDLGSAIGSINQSYQFNGAGGNKGRASGSASSDSRDAGDSGSDIICGVSPTGEN